jgi:hypothetical protein
MNRYPDVWYTYAFKFQSYLGKPDEASLTVYQELLDKSLFKKLKTDSERD